MGHRGRDRRVVGFTNTCAINVYDHQNCEFEPRSWRGVLDKTLCDKFCRWFSASTPVSSINKIDGHDITEMLLKFALNAINQTIYITSQFPDFAQAHQ